LLEQQSEAGNIDVFYADESRVSEQGYVPYGWQFQDEQVCIEVSKGKGLNCFAMLSRSNEVIYQTTSQSITAAFVVEQLDQLSFRLQKPTVVVLDNAKVHTAEKVKAWFTALASQRVISFLPAPLLTASEYNRTVVERTESKVAYTKGLFNSRHPFLCCELSPGCSR